MIFSGIRPESNSLSLIDEREFANQIALLLILTVAEVRVVSVAPHHYNNKDYSGVLINLGFTRKVKPKVKLSKSILLL